MEEVCYILVEEYLITSVLVDDQLQLDVRVVPELREQPRGILNESYNRLLLSTSNRGTCTDETNHGSLASTLLFFEYVGRSIR